MHEMSLAENILGIVEGAAGAQGYSRVLELRIEIGALAGVEPDALRFCLDVVLKDSVADGATIAIIDIAGQGWCMQCEDYVNIAALYDACPNCGGYQVQATAGTEMRVKDMLVE
jgi:hydrogenase nickel incorporation protein HypA/HybF